MKKNFHYFQNELQEENLPKRVKIPSTREISRLVQDSVMTEFYGSVLHKKERSVSSQEFHSLGEKEGLPFVAHGQLRRGSSKRSGSVQKWLQVNA